MDQQADGFRGASRQELWKALETGPAARVEAEVAPPGQLTVPALAM